MTRHKRNKAPFRLLKSIYIWHRYLGLAAALFVILLSATGLALNHTHELALDSHHVAAPYLLDWYGIHAPREMTSFTAGPATITAVGNRVYWNLAPIPQASTPLIGAVEFAGLVVIGSAGQLLLLTPEGELVERLDGTAGVPAGMQAIGLTPGGALAVHGAHGYYRTDENFLDWHETDSLDARWARASTPSPGLRSALREQWRGTGLTLERVLLDIHSGRILGGWGVYLVDLAAVLFLLLALSGLWLWSRRRASSRAHRRSRRSA